MCSSGYRCQAARRMERRLAMIRTARATFAALPPERQAELRAGIESANDEAREHVRRCQPYASEPT